MSTNNNQDKQRSEACVDCPAAASRRVFLRDAALAVMGSLALSTLGGRAAALAETLTEVTAPEHAGRQRTYALPATDSVSVDVANDVMLVRWQDRLYAFSLRCPHRGTRLEWRATEGSVFCPKHKARFHPDGSHESGRQSRDLDRYDIGRRGASVAVDLDTLRRVDREPAAWHAAVIVLD